MATGQGTVTFDFGSAPGTNLVETSVSTSGISAGSKVDLYMMGTDSTATHNAYEHSIVELGGLALNCVEITAGVGFVARAASTTRLTGTFIARYVWAD